MAIKAIIIFGISLMLFEAVLSIMGVATTVRHVVASLLTRLLHKLIEPVLEHLETTTAKQAIPIYHGNWWINFIIVNHLSKELTRIKIVDGF
jgi:hypothetical protein